MKRVVERGCTFHDFVGEPEDLDLYPRCKQISHIFSENVEIHAAF